MLALFYILHNFCEVNGESIAENHVQSSIEYDREFQPKVTPSGYGTTSGSNEQAGKAVTIEEFRQSISILRAQNYNSYCNNIVIYNNICNNIV